MIANLITLFRLMLVFVVISLFGYHVYLDILLVALIGLILFLDAVDGYVARKLNQTSAFGALLDIVGDRIVECVFWVYFARRWLDSVLDSSNSDCPRAFLQTVCGVPPLHKVKPLSVRTV